MWESRDEETQCAEIWDWRPRLWKTGMLSQETWPVNSRDVGDLGCKAPRMLEVDMES